MHRSLAIATPLDPDLILVSMSGTEQISGLSSFTVQLKSKKPTITAEQTLGQNVTIYLELDDKKSRFFNGYITRWSGVHEFVESVQGQASTKSYMYEAVVQPWLWFLTRQSNSRIFQKKTVPDILRDVFGKIGGLASFKIELSRTYPEWDYCCQYRESDFNFVSRLMEQEGIYYWFEHENGKHTLVIGDSSTQHKPFPGYEKVRFAEPDTAAAGAAADTLESWQSQYEVQSGKFTADDYDYLNPKAQLLSSAEKARSHPYNEYEVYDYPAEFEKPDDGRQYAATRLDEIQSRYQIFQGGGHVRGFQPGAQFELERHPVEAFNIKLLVTAVHYTGIANTESSAGGGGFRFSCSISAMPATQQFRPPRVTSKPLVHGPQTAVVCGPSGNEIFTEDDDKNLGRVKVLFRWDRFSKADANSSCWIRVAQQWAGNGYGAMAIPRVGHEVIVEFLEGDPDRPIITGSLYNSVNKPPFSMPAEKTRWGIRSHSSPGGGAANYNEFRFDDKKGSEEVFTRAEKDQVAYVKHDRKEFIGNEKHLEVKTDSITKVGGDTHLEVTGDDINKLGGGYHLKAGADWETKVGGKLAADAGSEVHVKAGTSVTIEAGSMLTLKVGGNFININSGGIFIKGSMVMVNSGGSAGSGSGASPKAPKTVQKEDKSKGADDRPSPKAAALKAARASSTPFCEICNQ